MLNLTIRDLFNFISSHFTDDFARLKTATSFSTFISHYNTPEFNNKYNNNIDLKFNNLSNVILSIFDQNNPLLCGESATAFINFIKLKKDELPPDNIKWISQDLITFCINTNTSSVSSLLVVTETQLPQNNSTQSSSSDHLSSAATSVSSGVSSVSSTTLPSTVNVNDSFNNISTFLGSLRSDISIYITDQLKFFMLNSLPKTAKDEHYQDLERLLNKKCITTNSLTINEGYLKNKIMQANIKSNKFPLPYLAKDPLFVDEFNKMIQKFQVEIQTHMVDYLTKELQSVNQAIAVKVKFINQIDTDASNKINCLESNVTRNNAADLTNSNEKLNRKIKESLEPQASTTSAPSTKNKRITSNKRNAHTNQDFNLQGQSLPLQQLPNTPNHHALHPYTYDPYVSSHNQRYTQQPYYNPQQTYFNPKQPPVYNTMSNYSNNLHLNQHPKPQRNHKSK
jgi:hypothetical protein